MEKNNELPFNYDYTQYENIIVGKCREIPSILAQGKTQTEVCDTLHKMTHKYMDLIRSQKR